MKFNFWAFVDVSCLGFIDFVELVLSTNFSSKPSKTFFFEEYLVLNADFSQKFDLSKITKVCSMFK